MYIFINRNQWRTQGGNWGSWLQLIYIFDPWDLSKNIVEFFKNGVSQQFREFEGRGNPPPPTARVLNLPLIETNKHMHRTIEWYNGTSWLTESWYERTVVLLAYLHNCFHLVGILAGISICKTLVCWHNQTHKFLDFSCTHQYLLQKSTLSIRIPT